MILVVGSTGMVGGEICRLLGEKGLPFRGLVRTTSDPAKVERIRTYGGTPVVGDLRQPDTLKAACEGVDTVICTVSSMPFSYIPGVNDMQTTDTQGMLSLIDAAKTACVKHFIHTTFSGNLDRDFPLRNAKRTVENHLKQSGMIYTILRPGCFMEIWLSPALGFDPANGKVTVYGTGDQKLSWISFRDVAQYAVASLAHKEAYNCTLEIGGPELLSHHEVIQRFERVMGKKLEVIHVPKEALEAQLAGATDPMQRSFTELMLCVAQGDPTEISETQRALQVQLTPLGDYIHYAVPS